MIRSLSLGTLILLPTLPTYAQEDLSKWDVEISPVVTEIADIPQTEPEPITFTVLSSNTKQVEVTEPPPLPELPPVQGTINLTVETVEAPVFPEVFQPVVAEPVEAVIEQDLSDNNIASDLVFISATVHASGWTFLTIQPTGDAEEAVTAWSNVDFKHFQGLASYQVSLPDGVVEDVSLVMAVGDADQQDDGAVDAPAVPQLPELASAGPSFVIVQGNAAGKAAERLEQFHDLYRRKGATLQAERLAREQELAVRKAALLADPPQPKDVTIRYWKGEPKPAGTEVGE